MPEWCPRTNGVQGRLGNEGRGDSEGFPLEYAKVALVMARRTGVTEACFCISTEGRPWGSSSRVQAS